MAESRAPCFSRRAQLQLVMRLNHQPSWRYTWKQLKLRWRERRQHESMIARLLLICKLLTTDSNVLIGSVMSKVALARLLNIGIHLFPQCGCCCGIECLSFEIEDHTVDTMRLLG